VELEFEPEAVEAIAQLAMERKTGARGLRAIVENAMADVMFTVPSEKNVVKCIVTKETITEKKSPVLVYAEETKSKNKKMPEEFGA
jgi:ATP-dependent Clp protease ATP-binding subunit ClpX